MDSIVGVDSSYEGRPHTDRTLRSAPTLIFLMTDRSLTEERQVQYFILAPCFCVCVTGVVFVYVVVLVCQRQLLTAAHITDRKSYKS